MKLLPEGARPAFAGELDRIEPSLSAVSLFLGFRESPRVFARSKKKSPVAATSPESGELCPQDWGPRP
jgi:hypothetical protein